MMKRTERANTMNNAGVNTAKYFSIQLPEGLKPGSTISLVVSENGDIITNGIGSPVVLTAEQGALRKQVIEDGYVRNTKLHRRWVMAQTFRMLNYVSYDKKRSGWTACLQDCYDYMYQFKMMLEEVRVLSKLEDRDKEAFEERVHFFNKDVVLYTCRDYMNKLMNHIDGLRSKKCKGVPYKRIDGRDYFITDINSRIYVPLQNAIYQMRYTENYKSLYIYLKSFVNKMITLPYDTPKYSVWVDAFKGAGAYYTLKNMIMFHDCDLVEQDGFVSRNIGAIKRLNFYLNEYKGNYYKLHAMLKAVIKHNKFDFDKRMREVYSERR